MDGLLSLLLLYTCSGNKKQIVLFTFTATVVFYSSAVEHTNMIYDCGISCVTDYNGNLRNNRLFFYFTKCIFGHY